MRMLVLVVAILLAGCTTEPGDPDPTETTTSPATTTTSSTPSPPPDETVFPDQEAEATAVNPDVPGMLLEGNITKCRSRVCVDVLAQNEGNTSYFVQSMCQGPWSQTMHRDGSAVATEEPVAHCQAFELAPMPPGREMRLEDRWNGMLWSEERGEYPAPAGDYTWRITFEVWDEDSGRHLLVVDFPVKLEKRD